MLFTGVALFLFSCGDKPTEREVKIEKIDAEIPEEDTFQYDTLSGLYMADFGGSPIRIVLNYVSNKNAIGYNIHKGLQRNLTGKVHRSGDSIQIILSEPGDNKFDGVFTLDFNGIDNEPKGVWESNSGKIPRQSFRLKKIVFDDNDNNDVVTVENFARIFSDMSDTIGEYHFKQDGLVLLKYYDKVDYENYQNQVIELKGSWALTGDRVTINWEDNKIFKNNQLDLKIIVEDYGEKSLKGKGDHTLWMMYGW